MRVAYRHHNVNRNIQVVHIHYRCVSMLALFSSRGSFACSIHGYMMCCYTQLLPGETERRARAARRLAVPKSAIRQRTNSTAELDAQWRRTRESLYNEGDPQTQRLLELFEEASRQEDSEAERVLQLNQAIEEGEAPPLAPPAGGPMQGPAEGPPVDRRSPPREPHDAMHTPHAVSTPLTAPLTRRIDHFFEYRRRCQFWLHRPRHLQLPIAGPIAGPPPPLAAAPVLPPPGTQPKSRGPPPATPPPNPRFSVPATPHFFPPTQQWYGTVPLGPIPQTPPLQETLEAPRDPHSPLRMMFEHRANRVAGVDTAAHTPPLATDHWPLTASPGEPLATDRAMFGGRSFLERIMSSIWALHRMREAVDAINDTLRRMRDVPDIGSAIWICVVSVIISNNNMMQAIDRNVTAMQDMIAHVACVHAIQLLARMCGHHHACGST